VGLDLEALHEDVLVVLEGGAWGEVGREEDNGLVDGESFGFGASVLWLAWFAEARRGPSAWRPWLFEGAGLDLGSCLESLEPCDFVPELLDKFDEKGNEFEKAPYERRLLGPRDLGNGDPHTSILRRPSSRAAGQPRTLEQLPRRSLTR